ncbi:MAG: hypothetical protein ACOCWM_04100 [Cyclobacteriaceae bacterium]
MKIEMLALFDLVQSLIKDDKADKLNEQPIKNYLQLHADNKIVDQLILNLETENYEQALELIENYRVLCKELLTIYNAILRDYQALQGKNLKEKIVDILNEKYGISKVEHVVELLAIKSDETPHSLIMAR